MTYNGPEPYRLALISLLGGKCKICGSRSKLEIDHIDGNIAHNAVSNFQLLCKRHHELKHKGEPRNGAPYRGKHVVVAPSTYAALLERKHGKDTFDDVVRRLLRLT